MVQLDGHGRWSSCKHWNKLNRKLSRQETPNSVGGKRILHYNMDDDGHDGHDDDKEEEEDDDDDDDDIILCG